MAIGRARIRRARGSGGLRVRIEGEFGLQHSLGHVSREIALALLALPGIDLKLLLRGHVEIDFRGDPKAKALLPFFESSGEEEVDVHIRHHWPPDYAPPRSGRWVLAQPWEFGSLPKSWVEAFMDGVDDVWCYTRYVQDAYLRAGFDKDRTAIIPIGIDPECFRPDIKTYPIPTNRKFKFLFVGGTLERKGADLLLEAYLGAFSRQDDVVLVVKDMGTRTFYLNQTMGERFREAERDPTRPEIVYIDEHISEEWLAALYRSCDVLVAPYRGEGFALPVLEAMGCGMHVITTGGGATDDFVDGTCGTRVVSDKRESIDYLSDGTQCVAPMFYMVPDKHELIRAMRWAYEHPEEGQRLGREATRRARFQWTWDRAASLICERLKVLANRPIVRFGREITLEATQEETKPATDPQEGLSPDVDAQDRARLELALMRRENAGELEVLERLLRSEKMPPAWLPLLNLAEKALLAEKGFALRGVSEAKKTELIGKIQAAKGHTKRQPSVEVVSNRPSVSLTMIVRDEEENIADCLKSILGCVNELIVVDTGSKDRTKVIASALGARVFDFAWVDSFAEARNEAIRHATGEWIFWLDADDRVNNENRERLKAIFAKLPEGRIVGYSMKVECVARPGTSPTVVDHVRLFPRHPEIRWEYRVHENILPAINRLGGELEWTQVTIHHFGYLDESLRERKRLRDQKLLLKNIQEAPDDPFVHFNLGHSLIDAGDLDQAAHHLRESISRSEPHYSQVKKAYVLLAQVERNRGRTAAALRALEEGRKYSPDNAELLYFSGILLHELGRLKESAECFERILRTTSWPKEFSSFDVGILDHKSRHRLSEVYRDLGKIGEAEELLSGVRQTHPDYLPAVFDLARLWIEKGRGEAARDLIEELRVKGDVLEALFLEGKVLRKEGKIAEALTTFERVFSLEPRHEEACAEIVDLSQRMGKTERGIAALRRRAEINPRSFAAKYDLARSLWEGSGDRSALAQVEQALALNPEHIPSKELRMRILGGADRRADPPLQKRIRSEDVQATG